MDHNGAFVARGVVCEHQSAMNGFSVMLTTTRVTLVAIGVGREPSSRI